MQIGAANLLALQQAQAKAQKPGTDAFATALAAADGKFEPLFSATGKPDAPSTATPAEQDQPPAKPAPAPFRPPGSSLDIRV